MILYTERQLLVAYATHVCDIGLTKVSNPLINIPVPSVEQFRVIYEEKWDEYYGDSQ
jgi:hypothetical protein